MDIVTLAAARKSGGSGGDVTRQYVDEHLATKVDKVEGKGLSTNDYTNADKTKVANAPISSTASGTSFALTDAADGKLQRVHIKGHTDSITAASVGEGGSITITTTDSTKSTSATLTTGTPYCSLSESLTDEVDSVEGVVHKKCYSVTLDGSADEDWQILSAQGGTSETMQVALSTPLTSYTASTEMPIAICNTLTVAPRSDVYSGAVDNTISPVLFENRRTDVWLRIAGITTVSALKTYLAAHPVTLVYELATPVELPLTASELAQLRNLRTYNPTTNITITDDPTVDVGYLLDTDNGKVIGQLMHTFSEMVLFETDLDTGTQITLNATITLSQPFTNFDEIVIEWGFKSNNYYEVFSNSFRSEYLSQMKRYRENHSSTQVEINLNYFNGGIYTCFIPTADDKLYITAIAGGASRYITKIIGRKYSAA